MTKYFSNTLWVLSEKVFTLGISLIISIWLARYLGPEYFGIFSYGVALVGLFSMVGHLGLEGLAIRELVGNPDDEARILSTIFFMKFAAYILAFLLLYAWISIKHDYTSSTFHVVLVLSVILVFRPFDVVDYWFQARVKIKYSSLAKIIGNLVSSLAKALFIILSLSLIWFAYAQAAIVVVSSVFLLFFFRRNSRVSWVHLRPDWKLGWGLLKQGAIIFLGAMAAIVYLKIDQIMIEYYLGSQSVGVYAVAATLSEAWYFIPVAIMSSLFPKLIKLKKDKDEKGYSHCIQIILDFFSLGSILLALVITFFADFIIITLYGAEYQAAADVLKIHIWAGVFIFMRAVFSKWILIEERLWLSLVSQLLGAIGNIALNLVLIPRFGIVGAAWATLISYSLASYFALWLKSETRMLGWMMTKSLFSFIRIPSVIDGLRLMSK